MKHISQTLALGVCLAVLTGCASQATVNNTNQTAASAAVRSNNKTEVSEPAHIEADGVNRISIQDAKTAFDKGTAVIVDTRAETAYKAERIKGSINMPTETVSTRFKELPKDKQIIFYCS